MPPSSNRFELIIYGAAMRTVTHNEPPIAESHVQYLVLRLAVTSASRSLPFLF